MEKSAKTEVSPLQNYFNYDTSSESNVFDELSTANSSAMMSSIVESKSTQDLFNAAVKKKTVEITNNITTLSLDPKESEPVVCKIFSQDNSSKTFFDLISPSSELDSDMGSREFHSSSLTSFTDSSASNEGPYPSPLQGFEDVSDVLNGMESDRSREAWIPSEETRRALILAATSSPGSYTPEKELLTMPGTVLEEDMVDGVYQLMKQYFSESEANQRKVLTVSDVSQDERGLRELIQAECFRAAVNLTGRLLTPYGQGYNKQGQPSKHTVYTIQLWFTRFCLLLKLNAFQVVESEANPWWDLDKPDLYYQFYPELYGGKLGTMVPFQMRLLLASLPAYLKNCPKAFERLYSVLAIVRKILSNLDNGKSEDGSLFELSPKEREISKQVWSSREARVLHSIINVALMAKNFILAIEVLQSLAEKSVSINQKRALESSLGRIFLQVGDVINAEKCFTVANSLKRNKKNTLSTNTADLRELVDQGLVHVAQNNYKEAHELFQKASLLDPSNIMVLNNIAVCLLYMGQLKNALTILTSAIDSNPRHALHEALLINVCTLFELESSHSDQNKLALLRQVAKYRGDAFNVSCLKLPLK
ncbi:unnamed protein product [Nezara viridula]|uniref:Trafficking protein particle complex subunit 12 n=1 Tax=Nezara viridula TaxID=85310 RepID=A0A9P0EBX5_NEZVI|nr:unnamed protein product [Nezara viridula]